MTPRYDVLTIHPEIVSAPLRLSVIGRGTASGAIELGVHDIRAFAQDRHRTVDDAPFGGGPGMVLKVDVVGAALAAVRREHTHVILMTAAGRPFDQATARRLAALPHLVFVCGHYEGIDARIETLVDEELSLGDFVLTGGELAAAAMIDAVARLIPGVLGNEASPLDESHADGLLEYPQYTRPQVWNDLAVPEVLLSGNHARIAAWRREQALLRTQARRPDLWGKRGPR